MSWLDAQTIGERRQALGANPAAGEFFDAARALPLWDALIESWDGGMALAGSSAGAMVLCDPMVDPRGGAFTLGLGLVENMTIVPHHDNWSEEKAHRTLQLAPKGLIVVGVDERTALVRDTHGGWRAEGAGTVTAWRDGTELSLADLP